MQANIWIRSTQFLLFAGLVVGINFAPVAIPVTGGQYSLTGDTAGLPALNDFAAGLENGQAGQVVGVYVPEVLALKVVPQPASDTAYVSQGPNDVTWFGPASQFGTTGLLA